MATDGRLKLVAIDEQLKPVAVDGKPDLVAMDLRLNADLTRCEGLM